MLCKKKLAFYIRLSLEDFDLKTSDKTESNSVSNQRKLLQDYYDSHPELKEYEIIEFCDDGYTGTNFDRPRFMAMMELARQKEIHAIIVKDLSRFGRDYLEVGAYLELILPLFGTRFISVNDNFDSNNYIGTTGGLELALRNLINGLYSKDLSVKIKSANKTRSRRGEYWGGPAFYGYRLDPKNKHKIIVDTDVASVIVRIFDECIEGKSSSQTARGLNDEGIPSPAAYKQITGDFYNGRVADEVPIWTASLTSPPSEFSRAMILHFTGNLCIASLKASLATSSETPAISNITLPGLTTATQYSGEPLPLPIRVSAGFSVIGLSGKILIHT